MPPSPVVTHHSPPPDPLSMLAGPRYMEEVTREPGMGAIPPSGQVCSGSCHLLVIQALALTVLTLCDLTLPTTGEYV